MRYAFALLLLMIVAPHLPAGEPEPPQTPSEEIDPDVLRKVRKLVSGTISDESEEREKAWAGLKDMGNLAVPGLVALSRKSETSPGMMASIILALGDAKDPRAAPALLKLLEHADATVRQNTARALGDSGNAAAGAALQKLCESATESDDVKLFAATSGMRLGNDACADALAKLAASPRSEIRSRAVFNLGKFGGGKHRAVVEGALKDAESSVREDAVEALRLIGKPDGIPGLIQAASDADYKVRSAAMDALRDTTGQKIDNDAKAWQDWWAKNGAKKDAVK